MIWSEKGGRQGREMRFSSSFELVLTVLSSVVCITHVFGGMDGWMARPFSS